MNFLEVAQLNKSYARHVALKEVSISVPRQSIFGLLGPNGAGKTTLLRIINQIIIPDSGSITFDGEQLVPAHAGRIGYMPEERGLYRKMKVGELLIYLGRLKGLSSKEAKAGVRFWLGRLNLENWWKNTIEELSKGMQQKVQFIATVIHDPDLIILDEPFSGFDPINTNIVRNEILRLKEAGKTIILSTHRMESVEELCSHIALVNRAEKVLEGKKEDIKESFKNNVYKIKCRGSFNGLEKEFALLDKQEVGNNLFEIRIRNARGFSANGLLHALMDKVEIESFEEEIPNIHDIFVEKITKFPN